MNTHDTLPGKTLETLVEDIGKVFENPSHTPSQKNLKDLGEGIAEVVRTAIVEAGKPREKTLRMSKIGTPSRKLWYDLSVHSPFTKTKESETPISASLAMKFLYGHILEQVLLFFIKESGHSLEGSQDTLILEGVEGHRDAKIDGVTVDIKTASSYGFRKFKDGTIRVDDPFGYIAQLSGYVYADTGSLKDGGALLVLNKESGELCLVMLNEIDLIHPANLIKDIKKHLEEDTPPKNKCYPPVEKGSSGNYTLHSNCGYCPFKKECWKDANAGQGLKVYQYSTGPTYFTKVVSPPRVPEILEW